MRKNIKRISVIFLCVLVFSCSSVKAEEKVVTEEQKIQFSVHLNHPKNQVDGIKSYINLNVNPNTKQEIKVTINNLSAQPITVLVSSANALNSPQGGIVYKEERKDEFSSLLDSVYYMDKNIEVDHEIHLKPNESKNIPVTITVPAIEGGTFLGGLIFEQKANGSEDLQKNKKDLSLTGKIKLVQAIAIQLNLPTEIKNENLQINDTNNGVYPTGAFVNFELENPNANIVKDISFNYEVTGEEGTVFEGIIPEFNVSPKSKVSMQIPWNTEIYKPGDYQLLLKPSYSDETIVKKFSIKNKDVSSFAKKTGQKVQIPMLHIPFYVWIIILIFIILLIYSAYRYGKGNKDETTKDEAA